MWNARLATLILPLGLVIAGCGGGGGGSWSGSSLPDSDASATAPAQHNNGTTFPGGSAVADEPVAGGSADVAYRKPEACSGFYADGFQLIGGKDATRPQSGLPKPAKGDAYTDPAYHTCVVRVTDHDAEGLAGFARNDYSRRQPFNADDSKLIVYSQGGKWNLYDVETLRHIREIDIQGARTELQWHPVDPDLLFFMDDNGGMTISTYNVVTDEKKVVADFRNLEKIAGRPGATSLTDVWPNAARASTKAEGSPSADARYWAFMVETATAQPLGMITYDMQTDTVTGVFDYERDGNGVEAPDHISMSPSGDFVVPSWSGGAACPSPEELGTVNKPCGLMAYSRDFSTAVGLMVRSPHSDIGIDANGRDVIVAGNYVTGWVEMWDLATGNKTRLWQIYEDGNSTAMHVSAKNFNKPGWVLISTYMEKKPGWYASKLMAVELKAAPRILNIAHTYNTVETYFSETHAVVNRDFTKVLFNSNWNTANMLNVDAYMVSLPDGAVPRQ